MLFTKDSAAGLADGTITLTFRTWSRPQAKVGGRYRTWGLLLEVDDIRRVDPGSITDTEARRGGYPSTEALLRKLKEPGHGGDVWRVEFRCLGADDRIARRNDATVDPEKLAKLRARLDRLDRASDSGAWTARTLRLMLSPFGIRRGVRQTRR